MNVPSAMCPGSGARRVARPGAHLLAGALLLAGCATPVPGSMPRFVYSAHGDAVLAARAPVFIADGTAQPFNRIGTPSARRTADGDVRAFVDPAAPRIYAERVPFATARGSYTNLVYRVHFERVPYRAWPFHLTAGPNGGLFVIVTLDGRARPVLVTTVHTCGCYVGIVPTSDLPLDAYPERWPVDLQPVYGEQLPARLGSAADPATRVVIRVRAGSHRVRDIGLATLPDLARGAPVVPAPVVPMAELEHLALDGGSISFFHAAGTEQGYVRDSYKPFEFLFMSWWMLDAHVGVDKRLGNAGETGVRFYTSFAPWRRRASDLGDFARFLAFHGWRL